ncbi:hypothetical protein RhoFasB10_02902 [Rhodococcus sp. B10]|nr:hypothetical protein [Rhodococcus sp. B10]
MIQMTHALHVDHMDVIGAAEAARLLGVSKATVNRRAAAGQLTAHKMPGVTGAHLFDRDEIESLAKQKADA